MDVLSPLPATGGGQVTIAPQTPSFSRRTRSKCCEIQQFCRWTGLTSHLKYTAINSSQILHQSSWRLINAINAVPTNFQSSETPLDVWNRGRIAVRSVQCPSCWNLKMKNMSKSQKLGDQLKSFSKMGLSKKWGLCHLFYGLWWYFIGENMRKNDDEPSIKILGWSMFNAPLIPRKNHTYDIYGYFMIFLWGKPVLKSPARLRTGRKMAIAWGFSVSAVAALVVMLKMMDMNHIFSHI